MIRVENNLLPESVYENLPDFLKQLTIPFEGRERDIVLLSSIGVISACLPKVYGIYDRDKYYSHLFILIIAPPASGKGVMNKAKKLIDEIHTYTKSVSQAEIDDCEDEKKNEKNSKVKCPDLIIKILPGNVSSSKVYKHLQNNNYGLLMFESEGDTISASLKQDWGNFSDVLRKAFHHEAISISRQNEDTFFEVQEPKLSLVISGTPDQVKPLIQSKENGLFSRFLYYYFNESIAWRDPSPNNNQLDFGHLFSDSGHQMLSLYKKLIERNSEVEIKLNDIQWQKFNQTMDYVVDAYIIANNQDVLPILKRHGLMLFRVCMILTMVRHIDDNEFAGSIECVDEDFETALDIIKFSVDQSINVSNLLSTRTNLTVRETLFLTSLEVGFTRQIAVDSGSKLGIPTRTVDYILNKMIQLKILKKVSNGNYQKI